MNDMNEISFGARVRQALNEGLREGTGLEPAIAARLRAARERALEARQPEAAGQLAIAGQAFGGLGGLGGFSLRVVLPMVVLLAGLLGIYSWQQEQRAADVEELDTLLLTDDLPPEAYLDKGFEAWLKKRVDGN